MQKGTLYTHSIKDRKMHSHKTLFSCQNKPPVKAKVTVWRPFLYLYTNIDFEILSLWTILGDKQGIKKKTKSFRKRYFYDIKLPPLWKFSYSSSMFFLTTWIK